MRFIIIMRSTLTALLASTVLTVSIACSKDPVATPTSTEPIDIGSLVALSGDLQGTGQDNTDAANLAIEQINATGVLGRKLRLVVEDDRTTVDGARTGYTNLLERKVAAIVGPSSSAQVVGIAELIATSKTLTIGRTSTSPLLSTIADNDFFFRIAPSDQFQAKVLARLVRTAAVAKLCVVHREDTYGTRLAEALTNELAGSVEITRAGYNPSTKDLSNVLAACSALVCDPASDGGAPDAGSTGPCSTDAPKVGLVMITFVTDGKAILANAPAWSATKQRFFFTDGARDTELLKLGLPADKLQGAVGTIPSGPDPASPDGDLIAAYRSAYQTRYGNPPPPFSQNAFDAVYAIASAIEIAGTTEGVAVRDAVRRVNNKGGTPAHVGKWADIRAAIGRKEPIDLRGASGDIDFDQNGDVGPPYYYRVWRIDQGDSLTESIEKVTE